jgi:hypothetical protein
MEEYEAFQLQNVKVKKTTQTNTKFTDKRKHTCIQIKQFSYAEVESVQNS